MGRLQSGEIKSIGISTALIIFNIALIPVFIYTPLARVNSFVFSYLILGMIFYGALLSIGNYLGKTGIRNDNLTKALTGVLILQLAYGMFGAGVLNLLPSISAELVATIIGITAGITLLITLIAATAVYWSDRSFKKFKNYSAYAFVAALVTGLVGSFSGIFAVITFFLVLAGFLLELVYEIWHMRTNPKKSYLNGLGIYIAFMGVFVEILRLVVESYLRD